MKLRLIAAAIASMLLGFATQSSAQSNPDRAVGAVTQADSGKTFTHGESKRCESLSGAAKDQCDREEATKTQGSTAQQDSQPAAPESSTGSSAAGNTFTHGESKRCESMSGAAKDQCDKEEATKTQGDAARDASK
jgi:FlaG/FlaF family flagellin (archaellin)